MTKLRMGVVGTGYWAEVVHAAGVAAHPDVDLVGVWGRDLAKANAVAEPHGARGHDHFDALLDEVDVPGAKVQRIDEVLADPQIIARGMVVEQQHPRFGTLRLPNLPFRFSGCDTTIRQVGPDLGQHNAEVAQSLGFGAAEIDAMQTDGVLFSR